LSDDADYLHITPNETIEGVEFPFLPDVNVPIVADLSSTIMSAPIDVSKYGVIYAGAQKNIGPSGVTIVIVRDDLLGKAADITPMVMNWEQQAANDSMLNTPSCYTWYICGLVFKLMLANGGVEAYAAINARKASKLYAAIDASSFYANPVDVPSRSSMNVPFTLANADLEAAFLAEAKEAGLVTLKGHRSIGGMRASIYNAMPESGVDALIAFMAEFEARNA
ncbi:MAG: phosphoserine aminotransferase, partial [Gammaproteobacteria bacterium]